MRPEYKFYIKADLSNFSDKTTAFTNGSDHVWFDEDWHEVYLGIDNTFAIDWDIDREKHRSRRMLSGRVYFVNQTQSDYTYIKQVASTSAELKLRIEMVTGGSDFYSGYFGINDGEWDNDRGIVAFTPAPDDKYRLFEAYGDRERNIISEVAGDISAIIPLDSSEKEMPSDCTTGTWTAFISANPGFPATNNLPGDTWDNWYPCGAIVGQNGWAEPSDMDPDLITYSLTTYGSDCLIDGNWVYVFKKQLSSTKEDATWTWENHENAYAKGACSGVGTAIPLNARGRRVEDIIQYFVDDISSGTGYVSTYFQNATNPVTGSTNLVDNLILYQKSDIKPTSDPATLGLLSFNQLMAYLSDIFNVYWFVDDSGDFRIEHESFFTLATDDDVRAIDNGIWLRAKNKWSFDKANMPSREHFEWMEASGIDFIGTDIVYDKIATGNKFADSQKDRIVPITTDIRYAYGFPEKISNEGWILLATATSGSDYIIQAGTGRFETTANVPNEHLSWSRLHETYWMHGRVLLNGTMNHNPTTFLSARRNLKQVEVTFPYNPENFDETALKTTNLGEGQVGSAKYRLLDGTMEVVFFYPDITELSPPEESFLIKTDDIWYLLADIDKVKWHG